MGRAANPAPTVKTQTDQQRISALRAARVLSRRAESDPELMGWFGFDAWEESMADAGHDDVDLRTDRGVVGELLKTGEVIKRPVKNGRENRFRAAGVDRITLSTLMRLAEDHVDADKEASAGRRTVAGGDRQVESITPAQWTRIQTMANGLARHLHPEAAREGLRGHELWSQVDDGSLWVWDRGTQGISGWHRIRQVLTLSAPKSRISVDRGAAELLLDLAATQELLERAPEHGGGAAIPVDWALTQERWVDACRSRSVKGHHFALQDLLRACVHVMGPEADLEILRSECESEPDPEESAARAVIDHVRDLVIGSGSINATQRTWIRKTLRALMDAGELPRLPIDRFDRRQVGRKRAWSSRIDREIARAHAERWADRGAAWRDFPFPGLADADNPYSLRSAVDFMTATGRNRRRLPHSGALNAFPRSQKPRDPGDGDTWTEHTTMGNLTTLSYFFGVLQRFTSIDLDRVDLRDVFTLDHAELVMDACLDHGWLTRRMARDSLIYMGLLSSPYLEHVAVTGGELRLADRFFDLAARVTGKGEVQRSDDGAIHFDGMSLRDELYAESDEGEDRIEQMRRSADDVQRVYEEALGVEYAYEGLELVYRAAREALLAQLDADSAADLSSRWDEIQPNRRRLTDLRALALWNDCLAAPMRARAIVEQTMDMRRRRAGALLLDTPPVIHKVPENGRYTVTLWHGPDSGYDLDLWELYRDVVRPALLVGHDTDAVWVNDMRAPHTKRPIILRRTPNYMIRRVLELAAPVLDVDVRAFRGARSTHVFRHAIGSFYVNKGEIETARILLHHAGFDMLEKVYSHRTQQVTTGAARAAMQPDETGRLLEEVRGRPELLELLREKLEEG